MLDMLETKEQQKKATNWGQIQADFYWADTLTALNIKKCD